MGTQFRTGSRARKRAADEESVPITNFCDLSECSVDAVDEAPNAVLPPRAEGNGQKIQEKAEDTRITFPCLPGAVHRRLRTKRRANHKNLTTVPNAENFHHSTEELQGHQNMEHTTQPLSVQHRRARRKRKTRREAEESDTEVVPPSCLSSFRCRERPTRINCASGTTQQQGKLNTDMFDFYLGNLWRSVSEEKRSSFAYIDCLWFALYTKEAGKEKVLNWIKRKSIFSTKYVFVPIVQWSHWSLLIFCHFGESVPSKTRTPCMLLLDSLRMSNPMRFEPGIRKFVFDIYKSEDRPETQKLIKKIPLLIPKVPQQRNGDECGKFVLYYIKLFMESAPVDFSKSEGYPYFMKEDWFTIEGFEGFCKELDSFSQ